MISIILIVWNIYLLEQNKTKYPEKIEYMQKIEYPFEICGYKSLLNVVCKHKMPKTKIAMSSGRKGRNNNQPNICGIYLCTTCNSQFGVNVYSNHSAFHPFDSAQVKHYREQNKIQKIDDVNLDNLHRVKKISQLFFNSVYEKFDPRQTEILQTLFF